MEAGWQELGLVGLVPDTTETLGTQISRVPMQLEGKSTALDRIIYLINLLAFKQRFFYRTSTKRYWKSPLNDPYIIGSVCMICLIADEQLLLPSK
jgi:hypothetical protein